jgi:hypothetical protein
MADTAPVPSPLSKDAVILEGRTLRGRPCRIVDNTATVDRSELHELLQSLIAQDRFRMGGRSSGDNTIAIGAPEFGHIQLGGRLYRLILFPYEARIERF